MITDYHNGDIFYIPNPICQADKFIFDTSGKYIKINPHNRIEEIGVDITKRVHCNFEATLNHPLCKMACKRYRRMLKMIDDEYFGQLKHSKL